MYSLEDTKYLMLRHLKALGIYSTTPDYQTKLSDVLPDNDGYGQSTTRRLYKGIVIKDLVNAGHNKEKCSKWPKNWSDMCVDTLAPKLIG